MKEYYYENLREINISGIQLAYITHNGGYHPLHWHDEVELLYLLNGDADITIEGTRHHLPRKHFLAIESCQMHNTYSYDDTSMFICIHISKTQMEKYLPDIQMYQIHCNPDSITDENREHYQECCTMMERLVRLYVEDAPVFRMEAEGIILQMLAHLIQYFSSNTAPKLSKHDALTRERIQTVMSYAEEHYQEPISLTDISSELGLGKEYFCRFFKKNMGLSFQDYLNEIRQAHVYRDLINTDDPITEIMHRNGITNQKLFNQTFKKLYGCTPSAIRNKHK
jgi:AraC-like DNA-binding protein